MYFSCCMNDEERFNEEEFIDTTSIECHGQLSMNLPKNVDGYIVKFGSQEHILTCLILDGFSLLYWIQAFA